VVCAKAMVLDAACSNDDPAIAMRRIGPALLSEQLWAETGRHEAVLDSHGRISGREIRHLCHTLLDGPLTNSSTRRSRG
jgi:hypothetical protein